MEGLGLCAMRLFLPVVLLVILAGCVQTGVPDDTHTAESMVSSRATTALEDPTFKIRFYQTEVELDGDPTCPGSTHYSKGQEPEYGDKWSQWAHMIVKNNGPNVPSYRVNYRGLLSDGSEMAPCLRPQQDLSNKTSENEFSLHFLLTYQGEGTTPYVDRVVLVIDGQDVATADARYGVMQCQESESPPPECNDQ